ncbi:MAG: M23 family metallopeptidase [Gemmatimonadota bacterium]|nr:M23 family metallopeptidase [Gemmatimonadota bacterium]
MRAEKLLIAAGLAVALAGCAARGRPPVAGEPIDRAGDAGAAIGADAAARTKPLVGGCGPAPGNLRPRYVLPFAPGEPFDLTQGNCGRASHTGRFSYSYDFRMPIGTPVIAARDGIVHGVRDDRPDGSGVVGDENFVIVAHGDGEYSRYIHLTTGGALVHKGDRVSRGDTIALSGHSGRSRFPHLHFDVARACRPGPCRTVPSAFLNAEPPIPVGRRPYAAGGF